MKTAILVDGGFYRYRMQSLNGSMSSKEAAKQLHSYCLRHLSGKNDKYDEHKLYRILYYDCPPMDKQVYHPLLKRTVNFKKTDQYSWMNEFLEELKRKRKVALRLGELADAQAHFVLTQDSTRKLCNGNFLLDSLSENDFKLEVKQKGVDMKIGLDIASLAYKKLVDQIILISGDSDFVPAAKLARREGIDFILDPLHSTIKNELNEHVDGIRTVISKEGVFHDKSKTAAKRQLES